MDDNMSAITNTGDILAAALIRHGKTKGNEEHRYIGRTDEPLSETGQEEILRLAPFYRSFLVPQVLISSPMKRCLQTGALLFPELSPFIRNDFRETDFGAFEGKNCDELNRSPELSPLWQSWIDSNGTLPFPCGESREEAARRISLCFSETITELLKKNCRCAAFLLHGGTIMTIFDTFAAKKENGANDTFYSHQVKNGDGFLITIDTKAWLSGQKTFTSHSRLFNII
jgi:alpha-ribazole phosphatase